MVQLNALVLSYLASGAVTTGVLITAWRRRPMPGARELALLMLAIAWWLFANALEAAATGRTTKIVWSVVAYPGIECTPVLYLLFALRWTHQDRWVTRSRIALLLAVPLLSVLLAATNELHHLLWSSVTLIHAWGVTAVYAHGPWFWVEVAYATALVGAGLVAIGAALYRQPAAYSTRMRVAIVASVVPLVASLVYALGLDASVHADLSSIAFALTGLAAAWGVLGLRALDPVPVAWAALVDMLADAVLVLAPETQVAALNPAATRLLGVGRSAVGCGIEEVLHGVPELLTLCRASQDVETEIRVGDASPQSAPALAASAPSEGRWFNVRLSVIRDASSRDVGRLVVLRDVTERRHLVETIRQLSLTDELTGLLNRRGFETLAEQQLRTSLRTQNRLWLVFADLDGLKDINDRLGHGAGDGALREFATLLRTRCFRSADILGRIGGDEFAVLATESGSSEGDALLTRLTAAVRAANEQSERTYQLSVSAGAAVFDPARAQTLDELLHEADRRMYLEKRARRADEAGLNQPVEPA
ncbi:MAG: histidine kinase N-terminal 7TM domain-containing protein [Candidatus Limnocylindrales bacterium]